MKRPIGPAKGPQVDGPRINEAIGAPKVRLIDESGAMIGIVTTHEALKSAYDVGLDLVEISPHVDPPVCKILNYSKFKFEAQKKKAAERKKQKIVEIKEIKIRPMIEANDYQTKLRSMKRFIDDQDKIKVTMRFRGRELSHQEIGLAVLNRLIEDMGQDVRVELPPKLEGKQMIMVLAPKI